MHTACNAGVRTQTYEKPKSSNHLGTTPDSYTACILSSDPSVKWERV